MQNRLLQNPNLRYLPILLLFLSQIALMVFVSSCCKPKEITDCEAGIIEKFVESKQQDLLLPPFKGSLKKNSNGFYGFQFLSVENNNYQSSIEIDGDCSSGSLWLGWMDINANLNPKWYEYRYANCDGKFAFTFVPEANFKSPTYPYYMSTVRGMGPVKPSPTGAWCEYDDYDFWYIPHWSAIIDGNHNLINDIHKSYNEGSSSSVIGHLNDAKPYNGQDLEDRTLTGWQSVAMRGVVKKAQHPYGDLDVDHLKECKETYSGIPAEITYPDIGADWDMYIKPDIDMGYISSNIRPNEVGCEIEDWTLRDDNYKYRPVAGDYLQTIGRWCIDCGHAIYGQFHDDFFTEIHPPEILVSSKFADGVTTAKVIGTGAFKNQSHQFMVWPGPRPSPWHILKWEVINEAKENMSLSIIALPASNPNHLRCRITKTGGDVLEIDDNGVVYQRCKVIYKSKIRCFWENNKPKHEISTAGLQEYLGGIKLDKVDASILQEIKRTDGFVTIKGMIRGLSKDLYSKVYYKNSGQGSKYNDRWEPADLKNDGFNISLKVGGRYMIQPIASSGFFTPSQIEINLDEAFLNLNKPLVFSYTASKLDRNSSKLNLTKLKDLYTPKDSLLKLLKPLIGNIRLALDGDKVVGKIILNQLNDANGKPLGSIEDLDFKRYLFDNSQEISKPESPFQLVSKSNNGKEFFAFRGSVANTISKSKIKICFYAGSDSTTYQLVHEGIVDYNDKGSFFIYNNPGFIGRVGIEIIDNQANKWVSIGFLSNWIEAIHATKSESQKPDLQFVNFENKTLSVEVKNELNAQSSEFLAHLKRNSSANKNLFNRKPKMRKAVKGDSK